MGLLDGVLGQVLNQVGGGGGGAQQPAQDAGGLGALLGGGGAASVLGGLLGGGSAAPGGAAPGPGGNAAMLAAAFALLQRSGGLSGLVQRFQQSGLGAHANSWVGTGPNTAVTGAQVAQALGPEGVEQFASQAGVPAAQAPDQLAQLLPALVNHMTPQGQVPANQHDLLSSALGTLRGALGGT